VIIGMYKRRGQMTTPASVPQDQRSGVRFWWPVEELISYGYVFTREAARQGLESVIEIDDQPVVSRTITERDGSLCCVFVYGDGDTRHIALPLAEEPAQPGQAEEES
jgi:hypothetical protein